MGCLAVLIPVAVLPMCCPRAVRGASDTSIRTAVCGQWFDLQVPDTDWFAPTLPPLPNAPFPPWEPPADTQRRGERERGQQLRQPYCGTAALLRARLTLGVRFKQRQREPCDKDAA